LDCHRASMKHHYVRQQSVPVPRICMRLQNGNCRDLQAKRSSKETRLSPQIGLCKRPHLGNCSWRAVCRCEQGEGFAGGASMLVKVADENIMAISNSSPTSEAIFVWHERHLMLGLHSITYRMDVLSLNIYSICI
jgi:hypothetical protein